MKKYWFLLLFALVLNLTRVFAQNHFIFIQSEARKPFTVSVNEKKFNSTAAGYVIIPKLKSGQYDLTVSFKDAGIPDAKFTSVIDRRDVGYTLKDLGKASVGLVDMQTYATLTGTSVDSYAKNDKPSNVTEKITTEKASPLTKAPEKGLTRKPTPKEPVASASIVKLKKGITKISEVQNVDNVSLMFIDILANGTDTIDVVIPGQKEGAIKTYNPETSSLFKWASNQEVNKEKLSVDDYQTGYNTKCVHLLTKEDLARLRKRMSAEINEDRMIRQALKISESKCFTTVDIKKLSSLFVKEQGKLKLFNALYNYTYDYIEYPQLESELSDAVYKEKFRSILLK